jgi:hypothetical protein
MDRLRGRLSYANVMSTIGVALALGGTSYAAVTLPRNSVGSDQIKADAVRASELASNAVSSSNVKNRSLLATDFALGQLPTGATGATGATGLQGLAGAQGPAGVVGAITVQREDFSVPEGMTAGLQIACPAGTKVVAGGSALDDTSAEGIYLTVSRPFRTTPGAAGDEPVDGETFDAWRVTWRNATGDTGTTNANAWAVCVQT